MQTCLGIRRHCWGVLGGILVMAMVLTACSGGQRMASPGDTSPKPREKAGPVPIYYDFDDVLIPHELKPDTGNSFVFQLPGVTAGVIAFKGRVKLSSLLSFFETNMAKDNWVLLSAIKSGRSMLLFQKERRTCVINISDSGFSTYVEIWVAPTTAASGGGLLK